MYKTINKILTHISCVRKAMSCVIDELNNRSLIHDNSKFNENELAGYTRFEDMPEGLEYGSKEHKAAMSKVMDGNKCFEIHAANNDHHPEHWDYPEGGADVGLMGLFPLIEMVCDWAGAHLAYGNKGSWHESVNHNISKYKFSQSQIWVIESVSYFLFNKIPELRQDVSDNV